nr:D-alanyl-D-alanine carboxypeptidase family protein [Vibrio furnissii]
MNKTGLIVALSATCMSLLSATSFAAPIVVPNPPQLSAKGYVLMDYNTGQVLVEHNANEKMNPASLTKLMTSYVAGQEMKRGNIKPTDQVTISQKAWAKNFPDSSKMFIEVGTSVNMMDLYRGLIVQSGNDASVAIAEHVAGSENAFVDLMNSWAQRLGLNNTAFTNPTGLIAMAFTPHLMTSQSSRKRSFVICPKSTRSTAKPRSLTTALPNTTATDYCAIAA